MFTPYLLVVSVLLLGSTTKAKSVKKHIICTHSKAKLFTQLKYDTYYCRNMLAAFLTVALLWSFVKI